MKSFIQKLSLEYEPCPLKIDTDTLHPTLVNALVDLVNGLHPEKNLSILTYYLGTIKTTFISFIAMYYLFINDCIEEGVFLESSLIFYHTIYKSLSIDTIETIKSQDYWKKVIHVSRKSRKRWNSLKWPKVDKEFYQSTIVNTQENIPRSVSTLIEKRQDDYQKILPTFEIKTDTVQLTHVSSPSAKEQDATSPSPNTVSISVKEKSGIKVDVLFLTKLKITNQSTGKWLKSHAELNQFTKEITLKFSNAQKMSLSIENGYFTWKNNWVQFRLINGLKVILRSRGAFEIDDRLKIVQFAIDCKCHYFEE